MNIKPDLPAGHRPSNPQSAIHNPQSEELRLRDAARHLEGVFVEQLFKAMRETVPDGGIVERGAGEDVFAGLLDQHLSAEAPRQWGRGLADAIYRQLRRQLAAPPAPVTPQPSGNVDVTQGPHTR